MNKVFAIILLFLTVTGASAQNVNSTGVTAGFMDMYNKQKAMNLQQMEVMQKNQAKVMRGQQQQALLMALGGACSSFFGGGQSPKKIRSLARDLDDETYEAREQEGYKYEEGWVEDQARTVGTAANATFAGGCANFINNEGKLGGWGAYALTQIRTHPESFGENVPSDIQTWCPNYPKMTPPQREMFWVWTMMAMASSESSCNPTAKGPKYNGIPLGLFQVWKEMTPNSCQYATDLLKPNENIRCAVDKLAEEMKDRDSLMINRTGITYWGVLRTDDWNKARGGDIEGARKTRALIQKYSYCNGAATGATTASN